MTTNPPLYHLPSKPRRSAWRFLLALPFLFILALFLLIAGHDCDPACHIVVTNNYDVPIVVHHKGDPAHNIPDEDLDTLRPGERKELASYVGLDGDIDRLEIRDAKGRALARLSRNDKNVICKNTTTEYAWDITVGP